MEFLTERLQAFSIAIEKLLLEEDLTQISSLWESTFDSVSSPVAIIDSNFNLLRANKHFFKELNGEKIKCHQAFKNQEKICNYCPLDQDQKNKKSGLVQRGDSKYHVFSYPMTLGNQNDVIAYVNYYLDVTRSRILQSKVIQNEKIAAIGHLAGNIAHELNNPLSGIKAMTQFILNEETNESDFSNDILEVNKAVIRCHTIISNLLGFTKEEDGTLEVVSLTKLVSTTLPLLKTMLADHNVDISLSTDSGDIEVSTSLVQQVIFNLIKNACQSIEIGPGKIFISTEKLSEEWTSFVVEDSGFGMSKEVMNSLYDPFFTTKKEGEGTGLGLYISKNIVEKFKGEISIESTLGKGTKFIVKLPIRLS
jgi:two-component system NtrC family sensor kinase